MNLSRPFWQSENGPSGVRIIPSFMDQGAEKATECGPLHRLIGDIRSPPSFRAIDVPMNGGQLTAKDHCHFSTLEKGHRLSWQYAIATVDGAALLWVVH